MNDHGYTDDDLFYVRSSYRTLEDVCAGRALGVADARALIARGELPAPTYVLPDGTEWFPATYFALLDDAGSLGALRATFARRYAEAARRRDHRATEAEIEGEWRGYLSGEYGACLCDPTPENIFEKERLVAIIRERLAQPAPEADAWLAGLGRDVEALDALEARFTAHDRIRFGGSVSRDRLITAPHRDYPRAFARRPRFD